MPLHLLLALSLLHGPIVQQGAIVLLGAGVLLGAPADPEPPRFRPVTIDAQVGIGYGLAAADVDGDRRTDLLLVDKDVVAWYRNPSWEKSVVARKLTRLDHVCLAARDLDGDGKAEVAVGAGWNPSDTETSGSLHYLVPSEDRKSPWEPVALPHQPTMHRIRWARGRDGSWLLISAPLHGRGNKDGAGAGARVEAYRKPADPRKEWPIELIDGSLHVVHNLEIVNWDDDPEEEVLLAAREGLYHCDREPEGWRRRTIGGEGQSGFSGASEVRTGILPGGRRFIAAIEPFHGNRVVVYSAPAGDLFQGLWERREIDSTLNGGHAVACADLAGSGSDLVVAGWRLKDARGKVGLRLYRPPAAPGGEWRSSLVDDDGMACEDVGVADLDGDGRPDLIAAGRDTHNLKVYFNLARTAPAAEKAGGSD